MPEKEGIETISELRSDFPHIKILAMSGGGKDKESAHSILHKPFVMQELLESVQKLFDEK